MQCNSFPWFDELFGFLGDINFCNIIGFETKANNMIHEN